MIKRTPEDRMMETITDHINGKRTLREEYGLVQEKKSTLSASCRAYLIKLFEKKNDVVK